MDSVIPGRPHAAAARTVAGPLLAIAVVAVASVLTLWLLVLPQPTGGVCPAVLPVPWWCSPEGVRAHGLRTSAWMLAAAVAAAGAAVLLGRRRPWTAWLLPPAVAAAGWAGCAAVTL